MKIYDSFEDVSEFLGREREVSPLFDERTAGYAQGLRMSGMSMTPWRHVREESSGILRAMLTMEYERGARGVPRFGGVVKHELRATPVCLKSGETAYWVDVYVYAFTPQEEGTTDESWYERLIDAKAGLALHPENFHMLSKESYWPRRYWLAWAWVFSDPMTWYADIEYGGLDWKEIGPKERRYAQAFGRYRSSEVGKTYERARFIWGGYAGQEYGEEVERYFREQHDVKLQGPSSRVPLEGGVELEVYAHPEVLPSLHVRPSLTDAEGALRRGKELQELLARM